jgi:hypothetical protein
MKKLLFGCSLIAMVVAAASCNKSDDKNALDRDQFIGNWTVYDTVVKMTSSGPLGPVYTGSAQTYDVSIVSVDGQDTRIVINNVGGYSESDSGTVSGSLITFSDNGGYDPYFSTAKLVNGKIEFSFSPSGYEQYHKATGTKF